jgi:peptidoglycan hydrolase-like protein with peptidoglycan-binding domain
MWVAGVVLTVVVAGAGAVVHANRGPDGQQAEREELPTTPVTRGDLVSAVQQPGQLGYSGSFTLVGQLGGTITAVPRAGQVIQRGQPVYAVDQRPVPLLLGSLPVYRALGPEVTGEDVRQLEQNLVELGHGAGLNVDIRYTGRTAAAVKRWQRALGVAETGLVAAGDAVVVPEPVRITSVQVLVGAVARPGEEIASASGTGHGAHVDLDRRYRSLATVDANVDIRMFGNRTVRGVITSVGAAATANPQQSQSSGNATAQTIGVDIRITGQEAELGGVFEGPVTVIFPGQTRRGVLSVPIEALTAMPGGEYAVVIVAKGTRRPVAVTTGLITSNRVEISGAGIAEGVQVEVPTL